MVSPREPRPLCSHSPGWRGSRRGASARAGRGAARSGTGPTSGSRSGVAARQPTRPASSPRRAAAPRADQQRALRARLSRWSLSRTAGSSSSAGSSRRTAAGRRAASARSRRWPPESAARWSPRAVAPADLTALALQPPRRQPRQPQGVGAIGQHQQRGRGDDMTGGIEQLPRVARARAMHCTWRRAAPGHARQWPAHRAPGRPGRPSRRRDRTTPAATARRRPAAMPTRRPAPARRSAAGPGARAGACMAGQAQPRFESQQPVDATRHAARQRCATLPSLASAAARSSRACGPSWPITAPWNRPAGLPEASAAGSAWRSITVQAMPWRANAARGRSAGQAAADHQRVAGAAAGSRAAGRRRRRRSAVRSGPA